MGVVDDEFVRALCVGKFWLLTDYDVSYPNSTRDFDWLALAFLNQLACERLASHISGVPLVGFKDFMNGCRSTITARNKSRRLSFEMRNVFLLLLGRDI